MEQAVADEQVPHPPAAPVAGVLENVAEPQTEGELEVKHFPLCSSVRYLRQ